MFVWRVAVVEKRAKAVGKVIFSTAERVLASAVGAWGETVTEQ